MAQAKRVIVVLGLSSLNRSDKETQGNATHLAIVSDPVLYPVAVFGPLMVTLLAKSSALGAADAATGSGSHVSFELADIAEAEWDTAIRATGAAVQVLADANPIKAEDIVRGAAFRLKRVAVKKVKAIPVSGVVANVTGLGDAIKISFGSSNPYGTQYEIQKTITPAVETSWESVIIITARKYLVDGLINGTRYYFRVRALNSLGKSVFSDVISQVAA